MLKDCKGQPVSAGDKVLLTRYGKLVVQSLVKETSESYILTNKVRLPKYATKYDYSTRPRWQRVDISNEPYLGILKVEDDFKL